MSTDPKKPDPEATAALDASNRTIVEELRKSFQPATTRLAPEIEPATILILREPTK